MAYFSDARNLLDHAKQELPKIESAYERSLRAKEVQPALLVEIKNLMENLRSALDFTAHGLFEGYGASAKKKPRIYFPYAPADQDLGAFRKAGRIEACIPGLSKSRPDIVKELESVQHFAGADWDWLPKFMELNNENKHQRLTPQKRRETRELRISSGGTGISLGEGASISIGPGASISMGGSVIGGGQVFDVNNPPRLSGPGKVERITWVSFTFDSNGEPVVPFLKRSVEGVDAIVARLSSL